MQKNRVVLVFMALTTLGCGHHNPRGEVEQDFMRAQRGMELRSLNNSCPSPGLYSDTTRLVASGELIVDPWGRDIEVAVGKSVDSERITIVYFSGGADLTIGKGSDYVMKTSLVCSGDGIGGKKGRTENLGGG